MGDAVTTALGDTLALADASSDVLPFVGSALAALALGVYAFTTTGAGNDDDDSTPGGGLMQPVA